MVNKIVLATPSENRVPVMKDPSAWTAASPVLGIFNQKLNNGIESRMGIRYVYGSSGPYTYDCSGFVWSVFQEAGIPFERSSARTYWNQFEPVEGADRFKFGTLVFLNGLGHMGIVADEKGFYHASSSKGITYSPFAGYWEKRVVGFRRIPVEKMAPAHK
jgi:cell wall-associated NlpC family hydrolase